MLGEEEDSRRKVGKINHCNLLVKVRGKRTQWDYYENYGKYAKFIENLGLLVIIAYMRNDLAKNSFNIYFFQICLLVNVLNNNINNNNQIIIIFWYFVNIRYGPNGVCQTLPLEGVSDRDYAAHIRKCHTSSDFILVFILKYA